MEAGKGSPARPCPEARAACGACSRPTVSPHAWRRLRRREAAGGLQPVERVGRREDVADAREPHHLQRIKRGENGSLFTRAEGSPKPSNELRPALTIWTIVTVRRMTFPRATISFSPFGLRISFRMATPQQQPPQSPKPQATVTFFRYI